MLAAVTGDLKSLAGTPGVTDIRSVPITGLSIVTLIFADGTDDYFARSQVLEKLRDADLPPGSVPSLAPLSTAVGEAYRYVIERPADMPLYEARVIQGFVVRPALRMVPGITDVTSFGGSIKQYRILVRPDLMKRYAVTLSDIQNAVARQIKLPAGYQMACGGQFENRQRAMKRLEVIVPIALFGIFILLLGHSDRCGRRC